MDDETSVSVSKGVFSHKGRFKIGRRREDRKVQDYSHQPWYIAYKEMWLTIQKAAEDIRGQTLQQVISDLKAYISNAKCDSESDCNAEITTGILLSGVNVHDHAVLFEMISSKLQTVTPHVAVLWSRDTNSMKNIIEETVYQLINSVEMDNLGGIKKGQCSLKVLQKWYEKFCSKGTPLVVILPDFESFSAHVLRDFILVLSTYSKIMKFALIFGVATTLHAVHRSLSYDVTSKLRVQVFHTQSQIKSLSDILESTVLNSSVPFKITGQSFLLLTDIFLFHNFSVDSFLQSYQLCLILHFYGNNVSALCCNRPEIEERIAQLPQVNIDEIKGLPSIVKYIENSKSTEALGKGLLIELLNNYHDYVDQFLLVLRCLHTLTATLPNFPMGKQLREVYAKAVTSNLVHSPEYKESLKLLGFLSKEELLSKLEEVLSIARNSKSNFMKEFKERLAGHMEILKEASLEVSSETVQVVKANEKLSRAQLKEKLLKMSQKQSRSPYRQAQIDLINYLDQEIFSVYLINPNCVPAYEIFCFNNVNLLKPLTCGSMRAAIDTALNDPQAYLKCACCKLENEEAIPATLPDLSIIYKLLLESRKLINMYDWLQAFLTIVNPNEDDIDPKDVEPKMQARFTRAVSELQLLGFIKTFRKKTDHVKRLT